MRQKTKHRARDYERLRNSPSPSMETPQDSDPSEDRTFSWTGLSGPQYPHLHPDPARGQKELEGASTQGYNPLGRQPHWRPTEHSREGPRWICAALGTAAPSVAVDDSAHT